MNDFPRTLSLLRREKRISQRKAAEMLGVSQALLSHYENGVREPGLNFIVNAAEYYHVSLDFLLGRTMQRDGVMITQSDLDDISLRTGKTLGDPSAGLNKKLLINSTALFFEILGKWNDKQAIDDVSQYLSTAFFKAYRYISLSDPSSLPQTFSVPESCFSELCDVRMKKCEGRMRSGSYKKNEVPQMSAEKLQKDFPKMSVALFTLLHNVGEQLEAEMK